MTTGNIDYEYGILETLKQDTSDTSDTSDTPNASNNTSKALIVPEPVVGACIKYGRTVENEIKKNPDSILSDDKLEELCTPLLNKIKDEMDDKIRSEIDEERAKKKDKEAEEEHDQQIQERRSNVEDTVIINIKSKNKIIKTIPRNKYLLSDIFTKFDNSDNSKKRKRRNDPEEINTTCVKKLSKIKATVNTEDKSEVLEYDTDDEYWDDCKTKYQIELESPYEEFVNVDSRNMLELLDKHTTTPDGMINMLTNLRESRITNVCHLDYNCYIKLLNMSVEKYSI